MRRYANIIRRSLALAAGMIALTSSLTGCARDSSPPPVPTANALSATETASLIQSQLDELWKNAGIDDSKRPIVERMRIIAPSEWASTIAECMTAAGLTGVSASPNGGLETTAVPREQLGAYSLAQYTCQAMYPTDPSYYLPLNESQLRYLYYYYSHDVKECLENAGESISDPPSEQAFIDNYSDNAWNPYDDVLPQTINELEVTCPPQIPDALFG